MRYATSLVPLLLAATLEAGGDALVRVGVYSPATARRSLLFIAGYGYTVNAPSWNFDRLLGGLRLQMTAAHQRMGKRLRPCASPANPHSAGAAK